jgi:signal transduction histidine kinase
MREALAAFWSRVSLRLRIGALLIVGLCAVQGASLWWSLADRAAAAQRVAILQQAQRAADLMQVLDAIAPAQRPVAVAALRYPVLTLDAPAAPSGADMAGVAPLVNEVWSRRLGSRTVHVASTVGPLRWVRTAFGNHVMRVALATTLADGQGLRVEFEVVRPGLVGDALVWPFAAIALCTGILVVVAARWAMRPLDRLASGAQAFGLDLQAPPLPESGPPEVRRAAQMLNRMQAQLRQYIDGRIQALAAMSHDLRTPITRLRLRAELLADPVQREAFSRNLGELEQMVQSTLDYLRGNARPMLVAPVDLDGLLAQVVEDVEALGPAVPVSGATGLIVLGEPAELRRALVNVLRNALVHAKEPQLFVEADPAWAMVHVQDRGPGIPDTELHRVIEPFYRLDASRNRETGGAGLGLAVAHDVATRHGGQLRLANRTQGGLQATLVLPLG